jgi:hypothetical protein
MSTDRDYPVRSIKPWQKGFVKHSLSDNEKGLIRKRTLAVRSRNKRHNYRLPLWVLESISNSEHAQ